MMWNMGYGFWGVGWLMMLLWWALPILGIVALIRWSTGERLSGHSGGRSSALEILNERYAKGEIEKKEYEEKKKDLL